MRVSAIQLSWFRGAADRVSLDPDCKSMVVYGENGSGKSSFVDAVEYVLNDGKIGHLAHEYSGKRQEKAIPNTHKPPGQKIELKVKFRDQSELTTEIAQAGSPASVRSATVAMHTWDYRRTVLRQNEVAEFIHDTKGGKYSALLPLLGLRPMELAAENLRQLAKSVAEQSKIRETNVTLKEVETKRKAAFGTVSDEQVFAKIEALHAKYCTNATTSMDASARCSELKSALDTRVAGSSSDQRRHVALRGAAELDLKEHLSAVRSASVQLAGAAEPLIAEKLEVLQSTGAFVGKLEVGNEVKCPACGRAIAVDAFQAHVKTERERLQEIIEVFEKRKAAIGTLCDAVKSLRSNLAKADIKAWRDEIAKGHLSDNLVFLDETNAEALRASCGEVDLEAIETKLLPLIEAAASASQEAPPDALELSADTRAVDAGEAVIASIALADEAARATALISFTTALEHGIREEIGLRAQTVVGEISAAIQAMWTILHPGEAIEQVRLYVPADTDKAIDIGLTFHGVEQESPRLTLSEGYRNSLGLCIFLAMAQRDADQDRPVFLDDVVVSLDRNHRGMIVELLEKKFGERQVILLTHDREWYAELRQQLDGKNWIFKALLPYETPDLGIRWSHKTTTFDDARAQLKERPDAAGNDARKIMDVECALVAERLQIRLPYLRGDRNDKRMAHEILERLTVDGKACFQKKVGKNYEVYTDPSEAFGSADRLLVSWGNRASHTFNLVRPEASKLIDACEKALAAFKCACCEKHVWFADAEGSGAVQCQCGQMRWRYGKG